jgi:PadR family transcriptional regulator, regulatory protein AphA
LTGKGWLELESWLAQTPAPPAIKDELFMKMAAWHEEMDMHTLLNHLSKRENESEELLAYVKNWKANGTSYINKVGMLAIRYAELKLEAELKWLKEAIDAIKNDELPAGQDPFDLGGKQLERRKAALKTDI